MNTEQPHPPAYVCTSCGHEQHRLLHPCEQCNSSNIASVYYMQQQYGDEWREILKDRSEAVNQKCGKK